MKRKLGYLILAAPMLFFGGIASGEEVESQTCQQPDPTNTYWNCSVPEYTVHKGVGQFTFVASCKLSDGALFPPQSLTCSSPNGDITCSNDPPTTTFLSCVCDRKNQKIHYKVKIQGFECVHPS